MANRIVRKYEGYLESFTEQLAATSKPGTVVKYDNAGKFAVAGADDNKERLFVLDARQALGESVDTSISANETVDAYEIVPDRTYDIRAANATYAKGTALTVSANGYVATAATGDRVIGHANSATTITTAGNLLTVRTSQGSIA